MTNRATEHISFPQKELVIRALSALVLAAVAIAATWSGPLPFAVLVTAVSGVLLWEWGRLMRGAGVDLLSVSGWVAIVAGVGLVMAARPVMSLLVLGLGAAAVTLCRRRSGWLEMAGILYVGLPSLSLVWLRSAPDHGLEAVLLVLFIVWATDTGAFVTGRAIGGPKLWASVSPNKTWAGLIGGVSAAAAAAWTEALWIGSAAPGRVVAVAIVLAVLSQLGDLVESALKRAHGVKDTSRLIPGHGGFMDRVDGLIFAAVAASIYAAIADHASPGAALLAMR